MTTTNTYSYCRYSGVKNKSEGLPFDLDAEKGVLGSILLSPQIYVDVAAVIRPSDFFSVANETIFRVLSEIYSENGGSVDLTILVSRLRLSGEMAEVGGEAYLAEIMNSVQVSMHAVVYAKIVRENSIRRALINKCGAISRMAVESDLDARTLSSMAEEQILSIGDESGITEDSMTPISDVITMTLKMLDDRSRNVSDGILTGFRGLDDITGGFHNSELTILAARPGMGKTALALNIAENVSVEQQKTVLFYSLEMNKTELGSRLICSRGGINGKKFRMGFLNDRDKNNLLQVMKDYENSGMIIDDSPTRTVSEIAANARKIKRNSGLSLIIIDYLGLIEPDDSRIPRQEQVAKIVRRLKCLAKELDIPVLCLCQLNRAIENSRDNRPKLSHLRESGAIEQDADVVMFVQRSDERNRDYEDMEEGNARVIVAKQRNGPIGDVAMNFENCFTRFSGIDDEPQPITSDPFASYRSSDYKPLSPPSGARAY